MSKWYLVPFDTLSIHMLNTSWSWCTQYYVEVNVLKIQFKLCRSPVMFPKIFLRK